MQVVLWDTRIAGISKDLAAGFGAARSLRWGGLPGGLFRRLFQHDRRPPPLLFARLAAVFRRRGHDVRYVVDRPDRQADLYVFCPSLATLAVERQAIDRLLEDRPRANVRILVAGPVASALPQEFAGRGITVVKGEAEQLEWTLDDVLQRPAATIQLGVLEDEDLDRLPPPDWSPFAPQRFRLGREFRRFPTAPVEQSRGCAIGCGHCPHALHDAAMRFREPEAIVEEIRRNARVWGFRSFAFCGPMFGVDPQRTFHLADLLGRLPQKIEFSVKTRPDLMPPEMLRALRRLGLTCVSLDLETADAAQGRPDRLPPDDGPAIALVETCRGLGVRTMAKFVLGYPAASGETIRQLLDRAVRLNPTFAEFRLLTPYPGTELYERFQGSQSEADFSRSTRQAAVLRYERFRPGDLEGLQADCHRRFYFRRAYFRDNTHLLWPGFPRLAAGLAPRDAAGPEADAAHAAPPRPATGSGMLGRNRTLRSDGPHARPGVAEDRSERLPPDTL